MLCVLAWQALPVQAAEPDVKNRVVVIENVKLDYAQVLNVEPVYQTLRATRIEEQCEAEQAAAVATAPVESGEGRINRMMDSVKEMFSRQPEPATPAAVPPTSTSRFGATRAMCFSTSGRQVSSSSCVGLRLPGGRQKSVLVM